MEFSLTLSNAVAMFGSMLILALIPSFSVLIVSARAATYGFAHAVYTTLGIVIGDIILVLVAIYGLTILSELTGKYFTLIKYIGGGYLIIRGIKLWRAKPITEEFETDDDALISSSFFTGLFVTLADQKAILFYLGFFPAFIDLYTFTVIDTSLIIAITILTVGCAKLFYGFLADKASRILNSAKISKTINIIAGSVMIGIGVFLFLSN